MEKVLKIIYNISINNRILNIKELEKILEILVIDKDLNDYILNIDIQSIRSNNLASYSNFSKKITIYIKTIELMIQNIEKNILILNILEKNLYKNLSILQVLLHEIEHANQEKTLYLQNNLESFLLKLSCLIEDDMNLYTYKPEERFAEIKSFREIIFLCNEIKYKTENICKMLKVDKIQRQLTGYHYFSDTIDAPTVSYLIKGGRKDLLQSFYWYKKNYCDTLKCVSEDYSLEDRLFYGFPISTYEYAETLYNLIDESKKYFYNKINIIRK